MKPLIGITAEPVPAPDPERTGGIKLELNLNYAQAVADAGGIPVVIPPMADMAVMAALIDGWLIPGGEDIDPAQFGQSSHPAAKLQISDRFEGEQRLFREIPMDLPILGICYGCQFLNVVEGGDLNQHIPDDPKADQHEGGTVQSYRIDEGSKLGEVLGAEEVVGKSYHHQAVDHVGKDLKVVAKAEDGTVEAIESSSRPWLIGVQWHPERSLDDPASQKLFLAFVEAAAAYAESKKR